MRNSIQTSDGGKRETYYYSAFEVGNDTDTIEYLSGEKNIDEIYHAIVLGIRDYFGKMGFNKAILGSSGGLTVLLTQAWPARHWVKKMCRA